MHFLVLGPFMSVVVLIILWSELGPISLAGFSFMMLLVPLQYFLAKYFAKLRSITAKLTDERVKKVNEIILGMRVRKVKPGLTETRPDSWRDSRGRLGRGSSAKTVC